MLRRHEPLDIPGVWQSVRPGVLRVLKRNARWREWDILMGLQRGEMTLWTYEDSFLITRFVDYPTVRVCDFFMAAGDNPGAWKEYEPVVTEWARANKADELRITGRPGWEKIVDWKKTAVELTKRI